MAYMLTIKRQLETEFSINVAAQLKEDYRVDNVQHLIPGTFHSVELKPLTVYVGDFGEFSSLINQGLFVYLNVPSDTPPADCALYVTQSLDPAAMMNSIQNAIFSSHQANIRKEEMFHILQAGYGVQAILDTARLILENPLTMCTTSFSMIAVSPKEDKHFSFEVLNGKYYLKKQSLENMRKANVMERLFHSTVPIIIYFDDDIGVEYIFCSIRINRAAVGYICLRCALRRSTEEDLLFLSDVAKMLSVEMQKDNFYTHHTGIAYEYFLRDLIEKNISSSEFARHRMEQLGRPAYQYFWVMIFSFGDESLKKLNSQYYIDQLLGIFRNSISIAHKGTLVLLLTSQNPEQFKGINKLKFENFMNMNRLCSAISYRFEEILDTHLYYRQALFLLKKASPGPESFCITYEANYQHHLFSLVSNQTHLKAMVHPDILTLIKCDALHSTDYVITLKAYFSNNRNAHKASGQLHIHKSTFFYRIGKIQTITSLDLDNSQLLFAYEFSFYVLDHIQNGN